jgi:hypothetical protein
MKRNYLLALSVFFTVLSSTSFAQLVGDNAFLKGRWLEVCIAPNGSWGNSVTVPAGYTTRGGSFSSYVDPITGTTATGDGMDFSYDQGHDGWSVGTVPWYGAYFLPGTPFDGWSVQLDDTMTSFFYSTGHIDTTLGGVVSGTVTDYELRQPCNNPNTSMVGTWKGTVGLRRAGMRTAMQVVQQNILDTNASWLVVTTKFINTTDSVLRGVYYFATADPDNDVTVSGSFPTNNHIAYQGDALNRHEVWARPPSAHQDAFSGLCSKDCRSKVLIYQSWPPSMTVGNDLDRVWAGTTTGMGTCYYAAGATTLSQDIAFGIVFNVGNIAPRDSAIISYAWIFSDTSAIDSAFTGSNSTVVGAPKLSTQGVLHDYTVVDSVFGCDMTGCGVAGNTFTADIIDGDTKDWTWSKWTWAPSGGLSATTGTHVVVNVNSLAGPTVFTITGTQDTAHGRCPDDGGGGRMTFLMYVQPCYSASSNSPGPSFANMICLNETLQLWANGDSVGASYYWWGPAGFVSTLKRPTRFPLSMADTGWYYVVRTSPSGSHDTTSTHVLLKPLPVITTTNNGPLCSGSTLNLGASPDSVGEGWHWSGPNGYNAFLANATRGSVIVSDSGWYKVVANLRGCMDSAYTHVVIDSHLRCRWLAAIHRYVRKLKRYC